MKISAIGKTFLCVAMICGLSFAIYYNQTQVTNAYFQIRSFFDFSYNKHKKLIKPYFDEDFYKKQYAHAIAESGLKPLDHFLQRSTKLGGGDFDPAPWFNVTIYHKYLWPCSGNPFIDYLEQPKISVPKDAKTVHVYANQKQLHRAWMATESFLRKGKFNVVLVLPDNLKGKTPIRFIAQVNRGMKIEFSSDTKLSFYHSPFIKNPENFDLPVTATLPSATHIPAIERKKSTTGNLYVLHNLYTGTKWYKQGIIDPCLINFGKYTFEPLEFSKFGKDEYNFKINMKRLSTAFDMMLLNCDIKTENTRVIPGYISLHDVNLAEMPKEKIYSLSFLLSLGQKGLSDFKTRGSFVYHFRKIIWDEQSRINMPLRFYISRKDIYKFPKNIRDRALPDMSKKWIYGSQFTVAIENSRQENYMSEKLLGSIATETIPIYVGCPNVGDYFDTRGILIANDPEDIIDIANRITPETYNKMLPFIKENKKRLQKLLILESDVITDFFKGNVINGSH